MRVPSIHMLDFLIAVIALSGCAVKTVSPPATYRVVDLGSLEQDAGSRIVRGSNSAGDVVGGSIGFLTGTRAFFLSGEHFEYIDGPLKTDWSSSHGVNDQGVVVGSYNGTSAVRAFLWNRKNGVIRDLGALPGDNVSEAFGINQHNEVVGYSSGPRGIEAAVWNSDGTIHGLGRLHVGDQSRGLAISERGEVVGTFSNTGGMRAFLWNRSEGMRDLGTLPGGTRSEAFAVNGRGEVVGYSSGLRGDRAFLWTRSGGMEDLGTLPNGNHSRAFSINNRGEVVGLANSSNGLRAFVWTRNRGMQDLNTMIPADSDFTLEQAVGINAHGEIVAVGYDKDDEDDPHRHDSLTRVFLLVP